MPRRIVTGIRNGKSALISDEHLSGYGFRSLPGFHFAEIWTTEATPHNPPPFEYRSSGGHLPGPGETQFQIVTFPPDSVALSESFDAGAFAKEQMEMFPGVASHFDPDAPGMHATPTVDYAIVLEGSIILETGDGSKVSLNRGDVAIQNGARHAWHNPGSTPVRMAFVLIGAKTS